MRDTGLLLEARRGLLKAGIVAAAGLATGPVLAATGPLVPAFSYLPKRFQPGVIGVRSSLLERARAALVQHAASVPERGLLGVADFNRQSADARFHIVNMINGRVTSFLVAHGRGSDPAHSGWVQSFSNEEGSLATSRGAYLTGERYTGKYGLSLRLDGLDYSNSNASQRAIVVHGADYVGEHMIRDYGKVGRSEGCFAVAKADLYGVLARLSPGHMIYADKA